MPSWREVARLAVYCGLAVGTLGLIAPFVNASRFSGPIQRTLEASLQRRVHFSAVHFTLLSGPGLSLKDVTIDEDPRYGLEPFAHAAALEAHFRVDKLLRGQIRFTSLRLVEPSLNLVRDGSGAWNAMELIQRLSAPRRAPLNLFPAFEISGGRLNFKGGTRKSTLYIADTDLSVYPERSGKLYVRFSGSPARTDRAGNGFGHLRGTANWYLTPATSKSNQLEAEITIDPSNLSEFTTLVEGYDVGVHGTVSARAKVEGPATALQIKGELRLDDVHRWDLLPASGEDWRIGYRGKVDLLAQTLQLETVPAEARETAPVALQLRVKDFLRRPSWSLLGRLTDAPAQNLLPLGRRMGLTLPQELSADGSVDGALSYSNHSGLEGGISIRHAQVTLPGVAPLRTEEAVASFFPGRIHVEPALVEAPSGGSLRVGGDYYFAPQRLAAALSVEEFSLDALKRTAVAWFGGPGVLSAVHGGTMTGHLNYTEEPSTPAAWSGQVHFAEATIDTPGLAIPLEHSQGHVSFDSSTFDLEHFSAIWGRNTVYATYRYNGAAKRPERITIQVPGADIAELEAALDPTLRAQSLLARLRLTRRSIPSWLAERNVDGDLTIGSFTVNGINLGRLSTRFTWQGTSFDFAALQLRLPEGLVRGHGTMNLASSAPSFDFEAAGTGFPWRGGLLSAQGAFQTSGTGGDSFQNLRAAGTFTGSNVQLSGQDFFNAVSGNFEFSFAGGWPNLRLSKIEADDGEDAWEGQAASQSDGKLILDLEHDGHQRRVVSTLAPELPASGALTSTAMPQ
ncbi:MAG: AsmA family protein [Acidobacteriaceae bacterium]|nr:AsmA family protein [Acidobacteriaceae bacterium]